MDRKLGYSDKGGVSLSTGVIKVTRYEVASTMATPLFCPATDDPQVEYAQRFIVHNAPNPLDRPYGLVGVSDSTVG